MTSLTCIVLTIFLLALFNRGFDSDRPGPLRVVLWGDSLAFEAAASFQDTLETESGATVLTRTFGGTAVCDWFGDMVVQLREWKPTVAVLAFSGNTLSPCMQGRDLTTAYRDDTTDAVLLLTAAGIRVDLVDAPPRSDQTLDTSGRTVLHHVWEEIDARYPHTRLVPAGDAVTDHGAWARDLPCLPDESCDPAGSVVVRSPDGVHFCPVQTPPSTPCPVYSPGAVRYGTAMAHAVLDYAT